MNTTAGLSELGARLYDPTVGRFTSVDPILSSTDPAAANGYTYSGNNPITYNDASGLQYMDHGPGNTVPTDEPEPEPEPTFEEGVKDGAGEEVMEVLDSLNPVTIAKNLVAMITDPPNPIQFFKDVAKGLLPIDKFKAAYDAYQSGDDYAFGKSIGKLAVALSGEIAGMIFGGGAKLVSMLGKAVKAGKGSKGNTPEMSKSGEGDSCETSFAGDTRVLMADGTTKPIAEIRAGDVVWATDPVSGIAGRRVVTHTWPHRDMLVALSINGHRLVTTEDHPFWSVTDQSWERADQLETGERVLAADGSAHLVTAPIDLSAAFYDAAYNLTVNGLHTYHVLTDPDRGPPVDVLVHNCDEDEGVDIIGTNHNEVRPTQDWINPDKVAEYEEALRNGADIDPIEVQRLPDGREFLIDGHHRYVASKRTGKPVNRIYYDGEGPRGLPDWSHVEPSYEDPGED